LTNDIGDGIAIFDDPTVVNVSAKKYNFRNEWRLTQGYAVSIENRYLGFSKFSDRNETAAFSAAERFQLTRDLLCGIRVQGHDAQSFHTEQAADRGYFTGNGFRSGNWDWCQ
jgi:hypothetical protein